MRGKGWDGKGREGKGRGGCKEHSYSIIILCDCVVTIFCLFLLHI